MRQIRELYLFPLTGLFDECHRIDYASLVSASIEPSGKTCLRPLNNIWWREALSSETLRLIVSRLSARYHHIPPETVEHRAVLADPEAFFEAVENAPRALANLGGGARTAFAALETLHIFCRLYSDFVSYPITLSLQEGLVLNELSSKVLLQEALNPATNPYLPFIEHHLSPILRDAPIDLAWIVGPIKASTLAMALMVKRVYPQCHVSVMGHSTEYYSLNKITKYLKKNELLFSAIDSIVLDDFENTVPQLVECLRAGQPLDSVPNLLYRNERLRRHQWQKGGVVPLLRDTAENGPIAQTPMLGGLQSIEYHTHIHPVSISEASRQAVHVDPSEVADVKLWPNTKCYWDQCNFCGINRKYHTLPKNSFSEAEVVADYFATLQARGIRYVWSFDEAIPPRNLGELAEAIIRRGIDIQWQTRSKIDKNFTAEICDALGRAGLREIRLGLESASTRVLSVMGKFPSGWSLELVEEIVARFHNAGVSVHFPTIIGFPTETQSERSETFTFLKYLTDKYPSVTFNMNILGLDVASKLFEHYEEFGITSLRWPAPAKFFLGNLLDWDCDEAPFDYELCDAQRNDLMRCLLYPWIPSTATIPPYIFYRLAETSRATLVWKAQRHESGNWREVPPELSGTRPLSVSDRLAISACDQHTSSSTARYFVYDWETHHNFQCDAETLLLLQELAEPKSLSDLFARLQQLANDSEGSCTKDDQIIRSEVEKLYRMGVVRHTADLGRVYVGDGTLAALSTE
jgi:hypothetical protein